MHLTMSAKYRLFCSSLDVLTSCLIRPEPKLVSISWVSLLPEFPIMTSWHGKPFRITGLCEGNPPVTGGSPNKEPINAGVNVFFDVSLNKRWNDRSSCRWFETPWRSLWRRSNAAAKSGSAKPWNHRLGEFIGFKPADCDVRMSVGTLDHLFYQIIMHDILIN